MFLGTRECGWQVHNLLVRIRRQIICIYYYIQLCQYHNSIYSKERAYKHENTTL